MKKLAHLIILATSISLIGCGSEPAVRGDPDRALENYVELGLGYLSEGNRDGARQNLLRALEINPDSTEANGAIALLYQLEAEYELAETHFLKALRQDRNFTQARNNYARFLYMLGRQEEARDQYQIVSEDVNYRLRPQAFIGLAIAEKALGNTGAAETALLRSISLDPRGTGAILELIQLKYEQQDYVTAKGYLDRFEAVGQSSPRSLSLGMQLAQEFGDDNALATYGMALKNMFPNSREARELVLREQQGSY